MVTINDVAKRCGVVKSTVSNALTGKKYVSPELKQKILDVCKELDFQPNFYASILVSGKTNIIALVLEEDSNVKFRGFYADLIVSCLRTAAEYGKYLLIYSGIDKDSVITMLKRDKAPIDGAIVMTPLVDDARIFQLEQQRIPCVIIGHPADGIDISYVDVNNVEMVKQVVQRLYSQGLRKFCLVNSEENKTISGDRAEGVRAALEGIGGVRADIVYTAASSEEEGERAVQPFLEVGMAFIASDGTVARGIYRAAEARGLDPLRDITIYSLGEDNAGVGVPWKYAKQDYWKLGEIATRLLIEEINGDGQTKQICTDCFVV